MAHPGGFGCHVRTVLGTLPHDDGDALFDSDAVLDKLFFLVGVVRDEFHALNAHAVEHVGRKLVRSAVAWQSKGKVGIEGVHALVLEGIGLHFGIQPDASTFLSHVDDGSCTPFLYGLEGGLQLGSTIATKRPKSVSCKALGVNSDER